jgi:hypothetical protein
MKKHLVAIILLAGTLAIISVAYAVTGQLQPATNATPLHSQQSSFYTTTASLGDANVTEFLVDTSIQFPIGPSSSQGQNSNFIVLAAVAFLLFMTAIVIGMKSSQGSQLL